MTAFQHITYEEKTGKNSKSRLTTSTKRLQY